jgi:anti-sigma B factor antagonist
MTMTIGQRAVGDVIIVDVSGRIAVQEGADQFRDVTRELIRQGHVKVVLNLQGVPYIDSTALGEIIRTYTSVIRKGGSVKLLNVSPPTPCGVSGSRGQPISTERIVIHGDRGRCCFRVIRETRSSPR